MTDPKDVVHLDANELAAFIDDALMDPARSRAESHLAVCRDCRSVLAAYSRAASNLELVFQPLADHRKKPFHLFGIHVRPVWLFSLAAGLMAAVTATALFALLRNSHPPSQVTTAPPSPSPPSKPSPPAPPRNPEAPPPAPEIKQPQPKPQRTPVLPEPDETLLARRGGRKVIGDKTFVFRDGTWIDTQYEAIRGRPMIEIRKGSPAYTELLAEEPALAQYAEIGPNVIVTFEEKAYKLIP